jgi:hypothetical protein
MNIFLMMRLSEAPLLMSLGQLMPPDRELDHKGQVSIGQFCRWLVFWHERDVDFEPLHFSIWLDALSQADLSFKPFLLCLRGDG